jgi:hypothetical protein
MLEELQIVSILLEVFEVSEGSQSWELVAV